MPAAPEDGYYTVPRRLLNDCRLQLSDVRVWMEIEQRQKLQSDAWWTTSLHELAHVTGLSRRQVGRSLKRLCETTLDDTGLAYARMKQGDAYRRPLRINATSTKIILGLAKTLWG